jgi:hypothetical protein
MELFADKMVGVVRAANMATTDPSIIAVNADERGTDGIIDLIDVTGDLGTLGAGGPGITTGTGGNVRYMHVGGVAYRDRAFGGGAPDAVTYLPGQEVSPSETSPTPARSASFATASATRAATSWSTSPPPGAPASSPTGRAISDRRRSGRSMSAPRSARSSKMIPVS